MGRVIIMNEMGWFSSLLSSFIGSLSSWLLLLLLFPSLLLTSFFYSKGLTLTNRQPNEKKKRRRRASYYVPCCLCVCLSFRSPCTYPSPFLDNGLGLFCFNLLNVERTENYWVSFFAHKIRIHIRVTTRARLEKD